MLSRNRSCRLLYCGELFNMLLHQKEIYVVSASSSTSNSSTHKSNPHHLIEEEKDSQDVNITQDIITELAFK